MLDKVKAAVAAAVVIASLFLLGSVCADALAAPRPIMRPLLPPGHSAVWVPALAKEATNLLAWSEDVSNAAWTKTNSTANSATTLTFTAQNGLVSQSITTLAGGSYTLSFKARAVTGNTALSFLHTDSATGNSTALTVTATLTRYYVTVLAKTGGGAVVCGIQDQNAAGQGQIEITEWQVEASSLHSYRKTEARQSVAEYFGRNLPLQLGSTSGADVNDPAWDQRGLVFDGVNDYAVVENAVLASTKTWILVFAPNNLTQVNKYLVNRGNEMAIIWEYVDNTVEMYSAGVVPIRTGSQMPMPDTSNHSIIYTYDGSVHNGYTDGAMVISVSKTVAMPSSVNKVTLGGAEAVANIAASIQAYAVYPRALTPPEVLRAHRWLKTQLATGPGGITLARSQSPLDRLKREIWARLLPMPTVAWAMPNLEVIQ